MNRRLLRMLPVARPHTGRHQARARGVAAAARPAQRPATALLDGQATWYLPPPPRPASGRVTGPLPRRVPGASLAITPPPAYGPVADVLEAERLGRELLT